MWRNVVIAKSSMSVTITSFSQKWCFYRHIWQSTITDEVNDRAALKLHYARKHKTSKKDLKEAFSIIFVDANNNYSDLDVLESKWINKLEATININKTILPLQR